MQTRVGIVPTVFISAGVAFAGMNWVEAREVSFEDRVAAQRAIEEVNWKHRIWPDQNRRPKPPLEALLSDRDIRAKVTDYLRKSKALEDIWKRPITDAQLQAEIDRIVRSSRNPRVLEDLFRAFGSDPFLIAECLARPILADRLIHGWYSHDSRVHADLRRRAKESLASARRVEDMTHEGGAYREIIWNTLTGEIVPATGDETSSAPVEALHPEEMDEMMANLGRTILPSGTADASWPAEDLPLNKWGPLQEDAESFYAVAVLHRDPFSMKTVSVRWHKTPFDQWWMTEATREDVSISIPGDNYQLGVLEDAGCEDDTWLDVRHDVPEKREGHAAVWTGREMIVWGGAGSSYFNNGACYDPATDTWTPTSIGNDVPSPRVFPSAVWTGTEMIVWGGFDGQFLTSGGRYDPLTGVWKPTALSQGVTQGRQDCAVVWTGSEMIVWGGWSWGDLNSGGRYDPATDTWTPTGMGENVPAPRRSPSGLWMGTDLIVWGGNTDPPAR